MARPMTRILVTGGDGKVGSHFIARILQSDRDVSLRALCHNRLLEPNDRLEILKGSISDRTVVRAAIHEVTHVLHCATCKWTPDEVMVCPVIVLVWLFE